MNINYTQLNKSFRYDQQIDSEIMSTGQALEIHILPNDAETLGGFEKKIYKLAFSKLHRRKMHFLAISYYGLPWLTFVALITAILFFLGILHTFEESIYEQSIALISHKIDYDVLIALALSWSIIMISALSSPAVLDAEKFDVKKLIDNIFSKEQRVKKRIKTIFRLLVTSNIYDKFVIWDPCSNSVSLSIYEILVEVNELSNIQLHVNVPSNSPTDCFNKHNDYHSKNISNKNNLDKIIRFLDDKQINIIKTVSAYFGDYKNKYKVFCEDLFSSANNGLVLYEWTAGDCLNVLEYIAKNFKFGTFQGGRFYLPEEMYSELPMLQNSEIEKIFSRIIADDNVINHLTAEGLLGVLQYASIGVLRCTSERFIEVLELAVEKISVDQSYYNVSKLVSLATNAKWNTLRTWPESLIVKKFSAKSLSELSRILEWNGFFDQAISLARNLIFIDYFNFVPRLARLYERSSQSDLAKDIIMSAVSDARKLLATNSNARLYIFLEAAWILAARKNNISDKDKVIPLLYNVRRELLAASLPLGERAFIVWRYWTTLATYYGADNDVDCELACLEKCTHIPGLQLKALSGTYVNLGVAYRELAEQYPEYSIENIKNAVYYGRVGHSIKRRKGDIDELAISCYNLTISRFFLIKTRIKDNKWTFYSRRIMSQVAGCIDMLDAYRKPFKRLKDLKVIADMIRNFVECNNTNERLLICQSICDYGKN